MPQRILLTQLVPPHCPQTGDPPVLPPLVVVRADPVVVLVVMAPAVVVAVLPRALWIWLSRTGYTRLAII